MRNGEQDQQIQFYQPTKTNVGGAVSQSYTAVTPKVWAKVMTPRGSESFEAARQQTRETIRLRIRPNSDIKTTWQLEWKGRRYNITAIDDSLIRKGELWIMAETKGN